MEAMQNTANEHCRKMLVGRKELEYQNLAWVLFKMDLQIDRYPDIGEEVTVQTFTKGSKFKFFPRYYIVFDENGNQLCKAASLWMLMDKAKRTTVSSKECGIVLPDEDYEIPLKVSTISKKVLHSPVSGLYTPLYSDIDINGHVNNVRYADILCNTIGFEVLKKNEISYISIDYSYEIPTDVKLQTDLMMNNDEFQFVGYSHEKQFFSIYGRLHPRYS